MRILIVNGEKEEAEIIIDLLKGINSVFDYFWVHDEHEAMAFLKNNYFEAVLLDYFPTTVANLYMKIDTRSGIDTAKLIKQRYPTIKILLFSRLGIDELSIFEKAGVDVSALDAIINVDFAMATFSKETFKRMKEGFEEFFKKLYC